MGSLSDGRGAGEVWIRHAAPGAGRRVAGRGGRGALRDCADGGRWRLGPPGGERPSGTAACSRHGRGHTPRRWRRVGGSVDRSSGGGAGPRRRSARGDLRLDNEPEPWHNSRDRLGLSELGAVTRVRWAQPGPHPTSESALYAIRTPCRSPAPGPWTPSLPMDAKSAPTGSSENREERGFPQRPQPSSSSSSRSTREDRCRVGRVDNCREFVSFPRSRPLPQTTREVLRALYLDGCRPRRRRLPIAMGTNQRGGRGRRHAETRPPAEAIRPCGGGAYRARPAAGRE